ncbi:hypothetical protein PoB_004935300 [Plakobranchus ocellatus]|uniref:Uncharacterized protein n=1 Tax=Plakobranchus ocellatus TaxID=259542 RepID=A0AAV4BUJ1_9GAST|nr:hypothetical protein PoB_004935300 [Plakobranchus ocellatus]
MDKYVVNVPTDAPESGRKMTYSIDVTWTENLANYLFIFPSLEYAGIRCERDKWCEGRFLLQKSETANGSLAVRLDLNIDTSENLSNYALFLKDKNQINFRIYKFSSRPAQIDQHAASETPERRPSNVTDVLLQERISSDYEDIVEGRRLSNGNVSLLDEDDPGNVLVDHKVSSSSHFQKISLENPRTWPGGASAISQRGKERLKVFKSYGDLPNGKADTLEHVYDRTETTEQEPEPFYSPLVRANSEMEEQPRPRWFMLSDSTDDGRYTGVFYSSEAEQFIEQNDVSTHWRCSADADDESDCLTELDSDEYRSYINVDG